MTEESSPAWTLTRNVLQYYSALLVLPSELAPTQQLRSFVGSIRPFWTFLIFLHYHWFCEALRCCCTWQSAGYCGHSVCSPTAMYNCGAGGPPYLALLAVKLYYIAPALHTCNSHCPPWQSGLVKTPRFNLHLQTVLKYVRFFFIFASFFKLQDFNLHSQSLCSAPCLFWSWHHFGSASTEKLEGGHPENHTLSISRAFEDWCGTRSTLIQRLQTLRYGTALDLSHEDGWWKASDCRCIWRGVAQSLTNRGTVAHFHRWIDPRKNALLRIDAYNISYIV